MSRPCPAAAYLSSVRAASTNTDKSSTINTDDLSSRRYEHRKMFMRDVVDFMYRCHAHVKRMKGEQTDPKFNMSDNEKKENVNEIIGVIKVRESEAKSQISMTDNTKMLFAPPAQSSGYRGYTGQAYMGGSPVSAIMGPGTMPTSPRVYSSYPTGIYPSQPNSRLATYGVSSGASTRSSPSTDPSSGVMRRTQQSIGRVCGTSGGQNLSAGYVSYECPYKRTSKNVTSPYTSQRTATRSAPVSRSAPPVRTIAPAPPASQAVARNREGFPAFYLPPTIGMNSTGMQDFNKWMGAYDSSEDDDEDYPYGDYRKLKPTGFENQNFDNYGYDEDGVDYDLGAARSSNVVCVCK